MLEEYGCQKLLTRHVLFRYHHWCNMNDWRKDQLAAKMLTCSWTVRELLTRIAELENDKELSMNEKLSQIKIIKDEITKVGTEIANIKKDITLLNAYSVN